MTRFIGIDFSTVSTGVAIHDANGWTTVTVKSKAPRAETDAAFYERMVAFTAEVLAVIAPRVEDVIAMESTFRGSGRAEARLHYAWHRLRETLARRWGCVVAVELSPSTVKKLATGNGGRASGKPEVLAATRALLGLDLGKRDDEADAVWLAVGASIRHGEPVIDLPAGHFSPGWKSAA
ncbi:crossover junction endodeoxyribonuclease RuvC [Microbacterium sp.]|uniref:crossover junction endodeoxyribonuclease RuvC n=1 Tax=Microbacterium sp. TaxID=51671 RepID=UPI0039E7169C